MSGHSHRAAAWGHWHREAITRVPHSDEVLSHLRDQARVQVLCEDTVALLGYRDTRNVCMARGSGAGYSLPVLVEVEGVGCHQGTSAVRGLRLLQQPPGYSQTDRTWVPGKQHCQGTAGVQSHSLGYRVHRFSRGCVRTGSVLGAQPHDSTVIPQHTSPALSHHSTGPQPRHTTAQVPSPGPTHWPAEPGHRVTPGGRSQAPG